MYQSSSIFGPKTKSTVTARDLDAKNIIKGFQYLWSKKNPKKQSYDYDNLKYGDIDSMETALVIHFPRRQLTKPHL